MQSLLTISRTGNRKAEPIASPPAPAHCVAMEAEMKTCPDCNGDGVVDQGTDDEQRCPTCGGLGVVPDNDDDREEVLNTSRTGGP